MTSLLLNREGFKNYTGSCLKSCGDELALYVSEAGYNGLHPCVDNQGYRSKKSTYSWSLWLLIMLRRYRTWPIETTVKEGKGSIVISVPTKSRVTIVVLICSQYKASHLLQHNLFTY
ncbi:unnamed protein product [Caretta caretta]